MNLQELIKNLTKIDDKGCTYVVKRHIDALNLSQEERKKLELLLKISNIQIKNLPAKKSRRFLIRNYDYGEDESYQVTHFTNPKFAEFTFSDTGELIGENYQELDEFLEEFIACNVVMKRQIDKKTGETLVFPSIRLNLIVELELSELEQKYVMEYLSSKDIRVCGYSESLESEFKNYDYYRTYKNTELPKPFTREEEYQKFSSYQKNKDPKLREELILHNMRLVPFLVCKYAKFYDINIHELESYGYEGLLVAIEKFNVKLGYKFSCYALRCIDGYIKKGCREILLGHRGEFADAYLQIKRFLESRDDTTLVESEELIDEMTELLAIRGNIHMKSKELIKRRICLLNTISLDDIDSSLMLEDFETEHQFEKIMSEIDYELLKRKINSILDLFYPNERRVIKLRFGLEDEKFHTLEEIGKELSLSRERIRAIETNTLKKLRHPSFGLSMYR